MRKFEAFVVIARHIGTTWNDDIRHPRSSLQPSRQDPGGHDKVRICDVIRCRLMSITNPGPTSVRPQKSLPRRGHFLTLPAALHTSDVNPFDDLLCGEFSQLHGKDLHDMSRCCELFAE